MKIVTTEHCTAYHHPGHPERPTRISATVEHLQRQQQIPLSWTDPGTVEEEAILRAHTRGHWERLDEAEDFDVDTPFFPGIRDHAKASVAAAIRTMQLARTGEKAFSLMRPPGHHATRNRAMGFCYLNNMAIAALEALATGSKRVAVFDFDVHHGNGTEAILVDTPGTFFFSVHQHPCYPGTGTRNVGANCFNFPVPPQTPRSHYLEVLESALEAMRKMKPDIIGISAGFDAFAGDPLAQGSLLREDFAWLGEFFRKVRVPVFTVLEGGYSQELPELILAYLSGWGG
jgi:acetoin utilization deacetylase AcuC-like enzyme